MTTTVNHVESMVLKGSKIENPTILPVDFKYFYETLFAFAAFPFR